MHVPIESLLAINWMLYIPGVVYVFEAFLVWEKLPSPKSQLKKLEPEELFLKCISTLLFESRKKVSAIVEKLAITSTGSVI